MAPCDQMVEKLSLLALGDLSGIEAQTVSDHVQRCARCGQEFQSLQGLIQELREITLTPAQETLFFRQEKAIQEALIQENRQAELTARMSEAGSPSPLQGLIQELRDLPLPQKGDDFFLKQRGSILDKVRQEDLFLEEWEDAPLTQELRSLPVSDPGDLFFRRQLGQIQDKINSEARSAKTPSWWRSWGRPLMAAAAVFLLIFGISRLTQRAPSIPQEEWRAALEVMAQEEVFTEEVGIEDLNTAQLDRLAHNLQRSYLRGADTEWVDEAPDWTDLNERELDILIKRMEAKAQT